jgi:[ribosomal protein S5]-alanine N-acetyltransferase
MDPITLQTERLLLREWDEGDLCAVHEYASDPDVVRYMPWGPNSEDETRAFLRRCVADAQLTPRMKFEFAITERSSGALIGGCGIRLNPAEQRTGDFGYIFRRDRWGLGLATEAARELVRFGFEDLRMHRIWATCDVNNTASAHVLRKVGLQLEGTMRENAFQRGRWRSTMLFAVLEEEYRTTH